MRPAHVRSPNTCPSNLPITLASPQAPTSCTNNKREKHFITGASILFSLLVVEFQRSFRSFRGVSGTQKLFQFPTEPAPRPAGIAEPSSLRAIFRSVAPLERDVFAGVLPFSAEQPAHLHAIRPKGDGDRHYFCVPIFLGGRSPRRPQPPAASCRSHQHRRQLCASTGGKRGMRLSAPWRSMTTGSSRDMHWTT